MLVYSLVLILLFVCSIQEYCLLSNKDNFQFNTIRKSNNYQKIIILTFFILLLIFAFRHKNVGTDTKTYAEIFSEFEPFSNKFKSEPVFWLINWIAHILNCDFYVVLSLVFVVQFYGFYLLARKVSHLPMLSIYFIVCLGILGTSFNGMRQFMAVGLFVLAIYFLINGKNRLYFVSCIFATLSHASALVLLPIFLIKYIKLNKKTLLIASIAVVLVTIALPYIIKILSKILATDYYNRYIVEGAFKSELGFYNLAYLIGIIGVFIWFLYVRSFIKKDSKDYNHYNIFLNLFFINVCVRLIATFSGFFPLVGRFTMYFFWSIVFLIPYTIKYFKFEKFKFLYFSALEIGGLLFFYLSAIVRNSNDVFPYRFNVEKFSLSWFLVVGLLVFLISNIIWEHFKLNKNNQFGSWNGKDKYYYTCL